MLHTTAIITVYHVVAPRLRVTKKTAREVLLEVMLEEMAWVVLHIVIPIIITVLVTMGFDGAYKLPFEGAEMARGSHTENAREPGSDTALATGTQPGHDTSTANVQYVYILVREGSPEWNTLVSQSHTVSLQP